LKDMSLKYFTDNQVLKHLFTKATVSRKEARWLETLGNFGIFPINLKAGKVHVLGDILSRAPVDSVGLGDRRGCDECKELLESEQWLAL
jgi:hypothetical protein